MKRDLGSLVTVIGLLIALSTGDAAFAQKSGGVLRVHAIDSPPSLSIHEEVEPSRRGR
jgi:hypothetical protein